jgi:hypothetical protein
MAVEIMEEAGTPGASREWIGAECQLTNKHLKRVCGEPPTEMELDVQWQEHELCVPQMLLPGIIVHNLLVRSPSAGVLDPQEIGTRGCINCCGTVFEKIIEVFDPKQRESHESFGCRPDPPASYETENEILHCPNQRGTRARHNAGGKLSKIL